VHIQDYVTDYGEHFHALIDLLFMDLFYAVNSGGRLESK
jgi:hypothetical protein